MSTQVAGPVVAVIPAFNEARFIGSVVLATRQRVDSVIVVDDGSSDGTADIASAAGAVVRRHPRNAGKAAAVNTGFQHALTLGPRAVVLLDGDGQHLAAELPAVVAPVLEGRADMVVGSRYVNARAGIPLVRRVGHGPLTWLTGAMSGVKVTDSQSGYRAFSPAALEKLLFVSGGFSVESEMQFLAGTHGLRTVEVSTSAVYVDPPKRSVLRQGISVLWGIIHLVVQHRPLVVFGAFGAAFLLLGLMLGTLIIDIFNDTRQLAVGYAMITVMLMVIGSSSVFTGLMLHALRSRMADLQAELRAATAARLVARHPRDEPPRP